MVFLLVFFIFLLIVALSIAWTIALGAPWIPTSMKMVHKMLILADVKPDDLVYDLGCGDGRIVITAAKEYGARGVGIDIDPQRIQESEAGAIEAGVENDIDVKTRPRMPNIDKIHRCKAAQFFIRDSLRIICR